MNLNLELFFKENSIPINQRKAIIMFLEQYNRENSSKTFKDYAELLIKYRVFSKVKKDQLRCVAYDTFTNLIILIFPEWDIEQLEFSVDVDDANKNIIITEENDLTLSLFNTIINF